MESEQHDIPHSEWLTHRAVREAADLDHLAGPTPRRGLGFSS